MPPCSSTRARRSGVPRGWRLTALAMTALSVIACSTSPDSATWNVRLSHVLSSNSEFHLMAAHFRDLMLERTNGQFRVSIYPSGQLGGERVAFEQIQVGAVHMAISGTPVLSGWVPEGQMFDLPYLFKTRDQGLAVMNGPVGAWWRGLVWSSPQGSPLGLHSSRMASCGPRAPLTCSYTRCPCGT